MNCLKDRVFINSSQWCKGQSGYYVNIFREFARSCTRKYRAYQQRAVFDTI